MNEIIHCERCGGIFLPNGQRVKKAAVGRGPVLDVIDGVCLSCRYPNEVADPRTGEIITIDELRRRQTI